MIDSYVTSTTEFGLFFSTISLLFCLFATYISYKKNNFLYSFYCMVFILLVVFQSFQIAFDLLDGEYPFYLDHKITYGGYESSIIYLSATSFFFWIISVFSKRVEFSAPVAFKIFAPSSYFYVFLLLYCAFMGVILIFFVVGFQNYLQSSRPGFQTGTTVFLVSLSPGLIPLYLRKLNGEGGNFKDWCLFLFVTILTFTFSRIHGVAYILTLVFLNIVNVHRNSTKKYSGIPGVQSYLLIGFVLLVIVLVFGAIRDALNHIDANVGDIVEFALENKELSLLSIERNYRIGIEGMSALSGAMSSKSDAILPSPLIIISIFVRGLMQAVPGVIKDSISEFSYYLTDMYWYNSSILSPGIESSYISFGYLGTFMFPFILNFICFKATNVFAANQYGPRTKIILLIFISNLVFYMRGSWIVWIGFSISYFLYIFLFYALFFAIQLKQKRT
jgi:hypothetical protein